ncbi:uncharacterized mitochondrial protein AtMg00810-like [Nicotiana sylvestris]|uniref:uncharacterized mitochondrial protein AtMg00810-like n=1 Tax=Nicotiana sylvestris TaxID=4096 RepID=UPI00388CA33E
MPSSIVFDFKRYTCNNLLDLLILLSLLIFVAFIRPLLVFIKHNWHAFNGSIPIFSKVAFVRVLRIHPSIFLHHSSTGCIVLLLYIDDIILTGDNRSLVTQFIRRLSKYFAMKDLGYLNDFIGIEAQRDSSGLLLSQTKYALDLFRRTNMLGCKHCVTQIASGSKLSALDGTPPSNPQAYQSTIGALQYITLTRPDLRYAVNHAC